MVICINVVQSGSKVVTKKKISILHILNLVTDLSAVFVHGLHLRLAEADWTHLLRLQTLAIRHQLTRGQARACNIMVMTSGESINVKLL